MAVSATFTYNGTNEIVASITGASIGNTYRLTADDPASSSVTVVAGAASFNITNSSIGGFTVDYPFSTSVTDRTGGDGVGITVFYPGITAEYEFVSEWGYDGSLDVDATWFADVGIDYDIQTWDGFNFNGPTSFTGAGATHTLGQTSAAPFGGQFFGQLSTRIGGFFATLSCRVFQQGAAGTGALGNPNTSTSVITDAPSGVGTTSATFEADVNPEGVSSTVAFEYGLTNAYGSTTASQSIGSGSSPVAVTQFVNGLRPGRTYHVRALRTP